MRLFLHNAGSPHYLRTADGIENVLAQAKEKARQFRYCLEAVDGEVSSVRRAMDYQMPECT